VILGFDNERTDVALESDERIHSWWDCKRQLMGDGQEKGKKKASDGRHDGRNPDGFNHFCCVITCYIL
jgi:hypothetical protein